MDFTPITPFIRGSDWNTVCCCPFLYYLTRRLGITSRYRVSTALARGSWFHLYMEFHEDPQQTNKVMAFLDLREKEIVGFCKDTGKNSEQRMEMIQNERRYCLESGAMYRAVRDMELPGGCGHVFDFIGKLGSEEVARELVITNNGSRVQLDRVIRNADGDLWIVDYKTTSYLPTDRLQICPLEFQTQHYMAVLAQAIVEGELQSLGISVDTEVAGMIHTAVAKPTIKFGMKDRDCTTHEHTLKSGPRKGQTETRRDYFGEPRIENYIKRVEEWYEGYENGVGEMPVNVSFTSFNQSPSYWDQYNIRKDMIAAYSQADPSTLPQATSHLLSYGEASPYAPYYFTTKENWPDVMKLQGHTIHHRDAPKENP